MIAILIDGPSFILGAIAGAVAMCLFFLVVLPFAHEKKD